MITEQHAADLNVQALEQGIAVMEILDDETWNRSALDLSSALGCQFRHCFDFYSCFLQGVSRGRIDYDHRDRNERIERDRSAALELARDLAARLAARDWPDDSTTLRVRSEGEHQEATTESTIGRELRFLLSHTVHHYAMIGLMLRSLGIETPAGFGVAPSTLRHWESSEPQRPR